MHCNLPAEDDMYSFRTLQQCQKCYGVSGVDCTLRPQEREDRCKIANTAKCMQNDLSANEVCVNTAHVWAPNRCSSSKTMVLQAAEPACKLLLGT